MSLTVPSTVLAWASEGRRVALATLVDARPSSSRPVGSKMAVDDLGRVCGSISGGCVEGAVVTAAEEVLASGAPRLERYGVSDEQAWEGGLACGGVIEVWIEPFQPQGLTAEFFTSVMADQRAVLVTALGGPRAGAKRLIFANGESRGTLHNMELDQASLELGRGALWSDISKSVAVCLPQDAAASGPDRQTVFVDVSAPRSRLIIVGAVDLTVHLTTAARLAEWRPIVVDPRVRFAPPERFPDAEQVIHAWPQEAFDQLAPLDPVTAVAVLTHDPKIDDIALAVALRSEVGYIGAMGSRRAQDQRRERLLAAGFGPSDLKRVHGPIGLDLGARGPGETAISIMSEIVAHKHGRSGGRLVHATGRIHPHRPARA